MDLFYTSNKQESEKIKIKPSCSDALACFLIYSSSDTFQIPQDCITKVLFSIMIQFIQNNYGFPPGAQKEYFVFYFVFLFSHILDMKLPWWKVIIIITKTSRFRLRSKIMF